MNYQLPADGLLPKTYRVTVAITDPKNPDWIISQPVAGAVRTVTAENQGASSSRRGTAWTTTSCPSRPERTA